MFCPMLPRKFFQPKERTGTAGVDMMKVGVRIWSRIYIVEAKVPRGRRGFFHSTK